ncbi:tetratricopeptide repeat protein [Aetokthonos hydrillicola Thurmond2011]|jgi:tetratricopeptide (TPR) repeat protein|uniref:Tetratricopeptide repeat protein n=1 Tax=Aetokthonos hydrillicola Thurmond2011 TaxID=2712845 RepID=A0AAP5I3I8_9CYAN|nr:tetratricopeptide repeat protein [Aetokthonos hydrillicola]MBO3460638.1 tetratricopeptide repeat protein [Aetokthonos hydrillicola CCALA 1050]MBW4587780.1 tetratricopeptide repeat protein [Aetokthonos hydrillicola CCALA 1050]MDR9894427.1 tetratricopeptide repeat protein [Aetokthonos hydrillicola Thurmond2011]
MRKLNNVSKKTESTTNLLDNTNSLTQLQKANSITNRAILYASKGRYMEAKQLFMQALEILESLFGKEHLLVANGYNNLGVLFYFQGRYTEAKNLYEQALELRLRLLGKQHSNVTQSLSNLVALYRNQGEYAQAMKIQHLLPIEPNSDIRNSLDKLAKLYSFEKRYTKPEPLS